MMTRPNMTMRLRKLASAQKRCRDRIAESPDECRCSHVAWSESTLRCVACGNVSRDAIGYMRSLEVKEPTP